MSALARILAEAARLYQTTEADIRLGWDERALAGVGAFGWLAQATSSTTDGEAALYIGRPLSLLLDCRLQFVQHLASDPALAGEMAVVGAAAATGAEIDRRRGLPPDVTPAAIARRLIQPGPAAITVSIRDLRVLAAAYLSREQEAGHDGQ